MIITTTMMIILLCQYVLALITDNIRQEDDITAEGDLRGQMSALCDSRFVRYFLAINVICLLLTSLVFTLSSAVSHG